MKVKVKFSKDNEYPLKGFYVKGTSPYTWIKEIQNCGLTLSDVQVFGLPNKLPNTVWGCFVMTYQPLTESQKGKHELSQSVSENFFIPEKSTVLPKILDQDNKLLFSDKMTVFHPEIGFVICQEPVSFKDLIKVPKKVNTAYAPEDSVFIPEEIKSFQVKPIEGKDVLKELEDDFSKVEKLEDKPLSFLEKAKLKFYKTILPSKKKDTDEVDTGSKSTSKSWSEKIGSLFNKPFENSKIGERMEQDFEELERRNQSQLDKLMDMFENNPEEALKYALPLDDEKNPSIGNQSGAFTLTKRNDLFSLFNSNSGGSRNGAGVSLDDDSLGKLRAQYNNTAEKLIKKGDYKKAAYVYLKLLKNYDLAATTLMDGGFYQEAASVYLKHTNNKLKAAECYEKGRMNLEAIEIYEEFKKYEKVGDLYAGINKREQAVLYYEKTVEEYLSNQNYILASELYKNKIGDFKQSQFTLLDGWKNDGRQRKTCLTNYLNNVEGLPRLKSEIDLINEKTVSGKNSIDFLNVIQSEYQKKNELSTYLKKMAYKIIAQESFKTPSIVNELKGFNTEDKEITKDIQRFKTNKRG